MFEGVVYRATSPSCPIQAEDLTRARFPWRGAAGAHRAAYVTAPNSALSGSVETGGDFEETAEIGAAMRLRFLHVFVDSSILRSRV